METDYFNTGHMPRRSSLVTETSTKKKYCLQMASGDKFKVVLRIYDVKVVKVIKFVKNIVFLL